MDSIHKENAEEKIKVVKQVVITKQGFGFFSVLTLILIVLKFTSNPEISWFWIIAAFFGPVILLGAVVVGMILFLIFCFIVAISVDYYDGRHRRAIQKINRERLKMRKDNERQ